MTWQLSFTQEASHRQPHRIFLLLSDFGHGSNFKILKAIYNKSSLYQDAHHWEQIKKASASKLSVSMCVCAHVCMQACVCTSASVHWEDEKGQCDSSTNRVEIGMRKGEEEVRYDRRSGLTTGCADVKEPQRRVPVVSGVQEQLGAGR